MLSRGDMMGVVALTGARGGVAKLLVRTLPLVVALRPVFNGDNRDCARVKAVGCSNEMCMP